MFPRALLRTQTIKTLSKRQFGGHSSHGPVYANTHTAQQEALGTVAQAKPVASTSHAAQYMLAAIFPLGAWYYAREKDSETLYPPEKMIIGQEIMSGQRDAIGRLTKKDLVSY